MIEYQLSVERLPIYILAGILLSYRVEAKTFGRDNSQSLQLNFTEIQQEFN